MEGSPLYHNVSQLAYTKKKIKCQQMVKQSFHGKHWMTDRFGDINQDWTRLSKQPLSVKLCHRGCKDFIYKGSTD